MRQPADKSYRIDENKLSVGVQANLSLRDIQSGKKHIFFHHGLLFFFVFRSRAFIIADFPALV